MVKMTIFFFMFPSHMYQATENQVLNTSLLNGQGSKQPENHDWKESSQVSKNQMWHGMRRDPDGGLRQHAESSKNIQSKSKNGLDTS